MNRIGFLLLLGFFLSLSAAAQDQPIPLITQQVDEGSLVPLHGTVHPLARAGNDLGRVPDSNSVGRMLLLLNRPPERQAALDQFLSNVNTRGSANYHQWLTPEQYGEQFGPADADVLTATSWLAANGFSAVKTSKSRIFIEFSGTAGQLRSAFHTEIHEYNVNGETHYANATEARIPAALAPLIKGISPLNDFRAKPMLQVLGQANYKRATNRATPEMTLPNGSSTLYALAPEDFATQYDVAPLYKAGITGSGQTIGIINESNIDLSLVQSFQKLFGLPAKLPQVVIEGSDPGELPGVDVEAYLDVEEAGAVAPGANVNLYIANTNGIFTGIAPAMNVIDPLYMAALRAVDDNQASVLSVSFGNCEGFMLAAGNSLWSALWQQAAAQGQTVLVSSGDSGSAGCDRATQQYTTEYGLAVNGLASTPWDVAVGGTDFYYSDYAKGGTSAASEWNQANDSDNGSLKAPLTEQVWDTAYGLNATGPYVQKSSVSIPAGGGGASGCIYSVENGAYTGPPSSLPFICNNQGPQTLYGYARPTWQTGAGMPNNSVRLIPDVSLFAAAQATNFSAYPICALPGNCVTDASGNTQIFLVGGTSASAPAMAGIMALVNQKYGRQGQADFTLYPLAMQFPAAFHDITLGSNNMTCVQGSPGCSADTNGDGLNSLQNYSATAGYDLATGLGSVDASVLVNDWNAIAFKPTTTALQITPTTAQVGAQVSVTANVKSSSGGGSPQGSVTIMMNPTSAFAQPAGVFALGGGAANGLLTDLPGGTYQVWAQYSGDGAFAASESSPQTMTISPAGSVINLYGFGVAGRTLNPAAPCLLNPNQPLGESATLGGPWSPAPSGTSFGDDSQVVPMAIVNGVWPTFGKGTGSVTFTVDGTPQATVELNNFGYAAWIPPATFNAGTHTIGASYSGDGSYAPAAAQNYSVIVPQVAPLFSIAPAANCGLDPVFGSGAVTCSMSGGDTLRVEVQISMANCHMSTGAITVKLGSLSQNVTLVPGGLTTQSLSFVGRPMLSGEAVFQNVAAGTYPVSATYAGDANSLPTNSAAANPIYGPPPAYTVVATAPAAPLLATTTAMSVNPPSFDHTIWLDFGLSATVTGPPGSTTPPTGWVDFFEDGLEITNGQLTPSGPNTSTVSATGEGTLMDVGSSQLKAVYSGDGVYQSSAVSQTYQFTINVGSPDFLLAPQLRQLTVQPGSTATMGFNLGALNAFNGTVALTCAPSSSQITCSVSPSTVSLGTQGSATLSIKSVAQAASTQTERRQAHRWPAALATLAFGLFFVRRLRRSSLWRSTLLVLCILGLLGAISCGSGGGAGTGGGGGGGGGGQNTASSYTVLVTGSSGGIVHNAEITVVVP